jgi:ribosomal protein S27AE
MLKNWSVDFDLRWRREDRAERQGKTKDEARELWSRAAKDASICARCFKPLAPSDSVTMEGRKVSRWHWVRVPVCLLCTLTDMAAPFYLYRVSRTRCLTCGRPLRLLTSDPWHRDRPLPMTACSCCADCERAARNERNNLRRRVQHEERICPRCGRSFLPKRADALTCSNTCRQALHRARVQQTSVTGRVSRIDDAARSGVSDSCYDNVTKPGIATNTDAAA